ncbi:MAG TPA: SDR family oxidoreductase [Nocardioidaceae bacterium]|nr:SDR family oxidoreductase [Nocardioidaceae bacterium]
MAVAVVTGAAGAIGRSISTRLAKDGYAVALLDASPRVEEVYEEFKAADLPACSVQCNITEPEQVRQAYATVCDTLGRPSLLVNNAGIYELCPTAELSWERWKATIDTNLGGAFLCSQAFGVGMLEAGGGVIVNIASGRAFGGQPKGVHYAASKAGVVSLTRSLAQEWAPTVRVNCVVPGLTDTPMPRSTGATTEELTERARARVPLQRMGQPSDVSGLVAFLAGPDAQYMTGQSVCINGGVIMR